MFHKNKLVTNLVLLNTKRDVDRMGTGDRIEKM